MRRREIKLSVYEYKSWRSDQNASLNSRLLERERARVLESWKEIETEGRRAFVHEILRAFLILADFETKQKVLSMQLVTINWIKFK